jgi:hypothetical protein
MDFQGKSTRERHITGIHSFDPKTGNAIIRVSEASGPRTNISATAMTIAVDYVSSWREWNLLTNQEIRLLRICRRGLEPY